MKILILCTGNSCRSQMAHGWLSSLLKNNHHVKIYSAGIEAHGINPYMKAVMLEKGIDVSNHTSNTISEYKDLYFDYVITVCNNAKGNCPYFQNSKIKIHKSFTDPANAKGSDEEKLIIYRKVRDEIKIFCDDLFQNKLNITV